MMLVNTIIGGIITNDSSKSVLEVVLTHVLSKLIFVAFAAPFLTGDMFGNWFFNALASLSFFLTATIVSEITKEMLSDVFSGYQKSPLD